MQVIVDIDLVVDVQLVVLHEAGGVRVQLLDLPHVLPQLGSALPGSLAEVLADVNVAAPAEVSLPQHLLSVFEVFKRDEDRSCASDFRSLATVEIEIFEKKRVLN